MNLLIENTVYDRGKVVEYYPNAEIRAVKIDDSGVSIEFKKRSEKPTKSLASWQLT